jgi:prophage tail gpP-like protein
MAKVYSRLEAQKELERRRQELNKLQDTVDLLHAKNQVICLTCASMYLIKESHGLRDQCWCDYVSGDFYD